MRQQHDVQHQHSTGDTPAPKPLWRGEYDRIYRLMAAGLRAAAAAAPRRPAEAATSPEGVP